MAAHWPAADFLFCLVRREPAGDHFGSVLHWRDRGDVFVDQLDSCQGGRDQRKAGQAQPGAAGKRAGAPIRVFRFTPNAFVTAQFEQVRERGQIVNVGPQSTLQELSSALTQGRISSRDTVEQSLHRLSAVDSPTTIFIDLNEAQIRADADAIDAKRKSGSKLPPLAGIPIAIKDLFDVKGEATRAGSVVLAQAEPALVDATAVSRLRRAGMIPFGRTNMTEFAYSGLGLNPHYGTPTINGRIVGGSTSGGAAAVANGIVPVALGSDTGGSCRIPAAFTGQVGYKATASIVDGTGMLPLSPSLDSVGWIVRSLGCSRTMLDLYGGTGLRTAPATRKLGVPLNVVRDGLTERAKRIFIALIDQIKQLPDWDVVECPFPEFDEVASRLSDGGLTAFESYQWHRYRIESSSSLYDPRVLGRIRRGAAISAEAYLETLAWRKNFVLAFQRHFQVFDAILFPTVPIEAPALADLDTDTAYFQANQLALRNSTLVNLFDGCAIALPFEAAGGGISVTLAGAPNEDLHLHDLAAALQLQLVP